VTRDTNPLPPFRNVPTASREDSRVTDHLMIVIPPRCDCPDCADAIYFLDPEGRWWCKKHGKQAIFVAVGYEYKYPQIVFTNITLTQFAGIQGREQWYALARACRMRPAALEVAIFDILLQLKLVHREEVKP
jgi:hypothetical protein